MATLTMDTHRIVRRLKDAGFTDSQAETVTDIIAATRTADFANIATKADIGTVQGELAAIRSEMATKADLAALEVRIIKWLVPLLLGQTGPIVALVKLLP